MITQRLDTVTILASHPWVASQRRSSESNVARSVVSRSSTPELILGTPKAFHFEAQGRRRAAHPGATWLILGTPKEFHSTRGAAWKGSVINPKHTVRRAKMMCT